MTAGRLAVTKQRLVPVVARNWGEMQLLVVLVHLPRVSTDLVVTRLWAGTGSLLPSRNEAVTGRGG